MTNYRSNIAPTWCPGCHNYLVFAGIQSTLSSLNIPKEKLVFNFDIGCAGNMADFMNTYGVHTLHGRSIATAIGEKIFNPNLTICVIGGDGGIYGEGLNHLIAAARMNADIKVFVSNNFLYCLTTGQTSPTTPKNIKTKSTPEGNPSEPIDVVKLLKAVNPDVLVKRVEYKNPLEINKAIKQAFEHKGFALIETTQVCVSFGKQLQS